MLLKQKIYASLITAIVLPLTISTIIFSNNIKLNAEEKLAKIELPTALGQIKNAIELELTSPIVVSRAIANNTFVKQWINEGEPDEKQSEFIDYLANIKQQEKAITSFIVSSITSNYYTADGLTRQVTQDEDQWFYNFLQSDNTFELSLDVDKSTGAATVFINYVIEANGQRVAIGGIGRSLEAMTQSINSYKVGFTGIVYLVNDEGIVQLHPNKKLNGTKIALTKIRNGKITIFEKQEKSFIRSSTPLSSINWHLVAEIPEKELYQAIDEAIFNNVIFGIIIAIIGFALVRILSNQIFKPIEEITQAVYSLTQKDGDLTIRLPIKRENEIASLAKHINSFLEQLHGMFIQVSQSAHNVQKISENVKNEMNLAMSFSEQQSNSTQTVAAAVNEMEMTVAEISESARNAAETASESQQRTNKGNDFVAETIKQMNELESTMVSTVGSVTELSNEIQSITHVLDVIKGISEQTNLLALNAAIEAARAGEQGRGFAVVADEVRTLAQKTAESTEEINTMITSLKAKAGETVSAIELGSQSTHATSERLNQTGETLASISHSISSLAETNNMVAIATKEQTSATAEISENIVLIADTANDTKQNVLKSSELCNALNEQANSLDKLIKKFTL